MKLFRWWWAEYVRHVGRLFPHYSGQVVYDPPVPMFKAGAPVYCPDCAAELFSTKEDIYRGQVVKRADLLGVQGSGDVSTLDCSCGAHHWVSDLGQGQVGEAVVEQ